MLASKDLDPLYDVLRALYADMGLAGEDALWFTTLYLAYYHLPSALLAFERCPTVSSPLGADLAGLSTGIERRNLRGGKVLGHLRHYRSLLAKTGGRQADWLTQGWSATDPEANFLRFWDTAQLPWGNGRWAAFKWADLLKNVHGMALSAPDMRLADCSGPKEGLQFLYATTTEDVVRLDALGSDLMGRMARLGIDWEQLETVLCNYKSLAKGKYYVGHDIDELQERIDAAPLSDDQRALLYRARTAALPMAYLGERSGWHGIQKQRMGAYKDAGVILTRARERRRSLTEERSDTEEAAHGPS